MPLIKQKVPVTTYIEIQVPDSKGWYRFFNGTRWVPVEVYNMGVISYFKVGGNNVAVSVCELNEDCRWGEEILMPSLESELKKYCEEDVQLTELTRLPASQKEIILPTGPGIKEKERWHRECDADTPVQEALRKMPATRKPLDFIPSSPFTEVPRSSTPKNAFENWPVAWKKHWTAQEIYIQYKNGIRSPTYKDDFRLLTWYCDEKQSCWRN